MFTWPNAISFLRILLVPLIMYCLLKNLRLDALILFAIASISDALDGFLARYLKSTSFLGVCLDAAGDKLLITCIYGTLWWIGEAPLFVTILIVLRDILIILGTRQLMQRSRNEVIRPVALGKISTIIQLVVAGLLIAEWLPQLQETLFVLVSITTFASGVVYAKVWFKQMNR